MNLFLHSLCGLFFLLGTCFISYGQQHTEVDLVISPENYELSTSGRTLVLWKGRQAKINMAADPVLSKLDTIGRYAFHSLDSLGKMTPDYMVEELVLPPTLRVIEEGAFYCILLQKIYLNSRLERIERAAFIDCALTEIYLPASLRWIEMPFVRCMRLDRIEVSDKSPFFAVEKGALIDLMTKELVYYPTGLTYSHPLLPDEIIAVAPLAFAYNPYIQKLSLPKGVRYIAEEAFADCPSLTTIELPSTVERVEQNAWRCSPVDTLVVKSEFPPQFVGDTRFLVARRPAHLYVVTTALSLYAGNDFWKKHFATIETMDVLESYFAMEEEEEIPFSLIDRMLYLTLPEGAREARLYDKEGVLVKVLTHSGAHPLLPGTYLLRIGQKTYKVICSNKS